MVPTSEKPNVQWWIHMVTTIDRWSRKWKYTIKVWPLFS